jgi:hypothetical protein
MQRCRAGKDHGPEGKRAAYALLPGPFIAHERLVLAGSLFLAQNEGSTTAILCDYVRIFGGMRTQRPACTRGAAHATGRTLVCKQGSLSPASNR